MRKYKKSTVKNKEELVDEPSDSELVRMRRQLEALKTDNKRLRKEQFKNKQNSNDNLSLTDNINKSPKSKANKHKSQKKEIISDSETGASSDDQQVLTSSDSETDKSTNKQVLKKRKHENKQPKVAIISSDPETNNDEQVLKKHKQCKKKIATTSSDNESNTEEASVSHVSFCFNFYGNNFKLILHIFSKKTPIAKPPNLKWYNLPKLLSLNDKVYASYRVSSQIILFSMISDFQ